MRSAGNLTDRPISGMSGKSFELDRWLTYAGGLANLAVSAGSGCPRAGFKKARK
jgi:hypothetical protein